MRSRDSFFVRFNFATPLVAATELSAFAQVVAKETSIDDEQRAHLTKLALLFDQTLAKLQVKNNAHL